MARSSREKMLRMLQRGGAVVEPAEQHVGQHVEARHQVELLEDHGAVALPVAAAPSRDRLETSATAKQNRPLAGVDETVDHAQQRGFAGARAADDADHLAFGNFDVDAADGGVLAKSARDGADLERG